RYGRGQWPGLVSEALFPSPMPMVLVGSPEAAQRLAGAEPPQIAREPLLGEQALWEAWFREAGYPVKVVPVAVFNDGGMLLQAVEQGMGLSLVRELLAADALDQGKLVKLSPLSIPYEGGHTYHLVYRPELADWPPLLALRAWLLSEIALAARRLDGHGPA
ncbi:MAG: LysR substrate-binding domain-containing protein, partial [Bordetella sp.]|nr:LysR substrate-binding domain-containing protein [Bordetella sp.]